MPDEQSNLYDALNFVSIAEIIIRQNVADNEPPHPGLIEVLRLALDKLKLGKVT